MKIDTEVLEYSSESVSFDSESCYYCGSHAATIDHVPPRSTRKRYSEATSPYPYYEAPACHECNSALSDNCPTLKERKTFIARWLAKKYRKVLNMPDWTTEQLTELSRSMQTLVRKNIRTKEMVVARIAHA
jgi:hypothetical protein